MAAVGTWSFSQPAVERLRALITAGRHATDAVEEAIAEVEDDPETGRHVVGRGGFPNRGGVLECDAAIMEGVAGRFGAVAALRGVGTPVRVARKVMDRSPHSLLVGEGAVGFAKEHGFTIEPNDSMLSTHSTNAYQEYLEQGQTASGHDTLGIIALDNMWEEEGSPTAEECWSVMRPSWRALPGGLGRWQHSEATGEGDRIMCFCPSFHAVQLMKQGSSPNEACRAVLDDIVRRTLPNRCFEMGLIALNMKGEVGAASSVDFPYTFWNKETDSVETRVQLPHSQPQ